MRPRNLLRAPRLISRSIPAAALCAALASPALAQGRAVQWDVEIDLAAYALRGYFLHLGVNTGHMRYELGAYAADIPHSVHGNDGFDASMRGWGACTFPY